MATKKTPPPVKAPTERGPADAHAWLLSIGVTPTKPRWYVEINLDSKGEPSNVYSSASDTVFRLKVGSFGWSVLANSPRKATEIWAYGDEVDVREDDYGLRKQLPSLTKLGAFLGKVEQAMGVSFPRDKVFVATNLAGAKKAARDWVASL